MELNEKEMLDLESLSRHPGYLVYKKLITRALEMGLIALNMPIRNEEEASAHNQRIGYLQAMRRALNIVDDTLKEYNS